MDVSNYLSETPEEPKTTMEKVLSHWKDIISERKDLEQYLSEHAVPVQESMFQSDFDPDYVSKGDIPLVQMKMTPLSDKSPELNIFRPMTKHINLASNIVTGISDGKEPVAVIAIKRDSDRKLWITAFEVSENYRGHGLGKQILHWLIRRHKEPIYLAVHPDNKVAIFLYTDLGFELDRFSQKEYLNGTRRNVIMVRR